MKKLSRKLLIYLVVSLIVFSTVLTGCGQGPQGSVKTKIITDQLGRKVEIPAKIERAAALHIFTAKIMYALGQGDKLAHQALYGKEGEALKKANPKFTELPCLEENDHRQVNVESLVKVKPQVVFVYAAFDQKDVERFESAGLKVIGVKGETFEQAFEAIKLVGEVFDCQDKAQEFTKYVQDKIEMVKDRVKDIPQDQRPKVLITGPKSIYAVATGEMLQNMIIETAGGVNVASELKGFWTETSPEQIVTWNPDYIFLGSSFGDDTIEEIYNNPALATVNAVKNKKVFIFPSNIGWWDFPLPQSVLGIVWTGKTINPDKFQDVDMLKVADEYYEKYVGFSFSAMGGKLN